MSRKLLFDWILPWESRSPFPCVVDVDVYVTGVLHAARYHGVGDFAHGLVVNVPGELVPAIPDPWASVKARSAPKVNDANINPASKERFIPLRVYQSTTGPIGPDRHNAHT